MPEQFDVSSLVLYSPTATAADVAETQVIFPPCDVDVYNLPAKPHAWLFFVFYPLPRRASAAVNHLKRFHEKKKAGPRPHSVYLDHIIRKAMASSSRREQSVRTHKDIYSIKVWGRERDLRLSVGVNCMNSMGGLVLINSVVFFTVFSFDVLFTL